MAYAVAIRNFKQNNKIMYRKKCRNKVHKIKWNFPK